MKTRSAKAKGKRLERWLRDQLLSHFQALTKEDIRVTIGVESGEDIKLSKRAKLQIPYSFECKNREVFTTLYGFYEQAGQGVGEPAVLIKMNSKKPLILIDAEHFVQLIKKEQENVTRRYNDARDAYNLPNEGT